MRGTLFTGNDTEDRDLRVQLMKTSDGHIFETRVHYDPIVNDSNPCQSAFDDVNGCDRKVNAVSNPQIQHNRN